MRSGLFLFIFVAWGMAAFAQTTFTYDNLVAAEHSPVVVYGSANEGSGKRNVFLVEQPNAVNPLGNPIQVDDTVQKLPSASPKVNSAALPQQESAPRFVQENLPVNPQLSDTETPQIVNKQIQDTLYESGGRIYDLQSYPVSDVDYIETPNIDPTITTYPPI